MFIGHYGAAFGAKSIAPEVSLGTLFLAAQFPDLLWSTLLLLGFESVRISPSETFATPLLFEHYPISHSLLSVMGWALAVALIYLALRRNRRGAVVLGLLVISHWLLDVIVHRPDLPLFPGSSMLVGLSLWSSLAASLLVEAALFALGIWFYVRATKPVDSVGVWGLWGLVLFFSAISIGNFFGAPPPSAQAVAWVGELQWLMVLWGYWVDKHRCKTL